MHRETNKLIDRLIRLKYDHNGAELTDGEELIDIVEDIIYILDDILQEEVN